MPLATGDRLGPYSVLSLLGRGGMGEVYKALDTRLNREVAIKVSAERFSERFEREARAIAALNHPNICTLYDVGPNYLVMEFVDGDAINTRLKSGPIPLEESLNIARQIASALEAAHDKLITHRDLKPGNVMIKPDGVVKVLDFGLAKFGAPAPTSIGEDSPTLTMAATQSGTILGTAQYMSPEQAKGKPVDKRADIWAFGVMLHEMVTGKQLFKREDLTETLAAVVLQEPDLSAAPERIRPLLKRCLEKEPSKRLRDISGIEFLLDAPKSGTGSPAQARSLPYILAAAIALVVAGVALWAPWRTEPVQRAVVLDIFPGKDETLAPNHPAVAPDGHAVALQVIDKAGAHLAIRSIDSDELRTLPGTEGASYADWSPDSLSLIFVAGGKLKRIDVAGGPAQVLCDYNGASIPVRAWSPAGVILFPGPKGDFMRVSDQGGTPEQATTVDKSQQEFRHGIAQFLPDGKRFLYFAQSTDPEKSAMVAASLDDKNMRTTVLKTPRAAFYAPGPDGEEYLLYPRDNALVAQSFDSASLKLSAQAFLVLPEIRLNNDHPFMTVSPTGLLAFSKSSVNAGASIQLRWKDRSGKALGDAGPPGTYTTFSLSPDEMRVAVEKTENGNRDIHLMDLAQKLLTRFTFDPTQETFPIWLPDGSQVTFRKNPGSPQLFQKPIGGTATEKPLGQVPLGIPMDWSRDGQHLLYSNTNGDLHVFSGGSSGAKIEPFTQTPITENHGQFSPDGKWIVYDSAESGRQEVWMQPYPATGAKFQISTAGGLMPRWRADGKELYFLTDTDRVLHAVPMTLGASPQWGAPVRLFSMVLGISVNAAFWPYAVSASGQKFLVADQIEGAQQQPITVVTNWLAIAKRK